MHQSSVSTILYTEQESFGCSSVIIGYVNVLISYTMWLKCASNLLPCVQYVVLKGGLHVHCSHQSFTCKLRFRIREQFALVLVYIEPFHTKSVSYLITLGLLSVLHWSWLITVLITTAQQCDIIQCGVFCLSTLTFVYCGWHGVEAQLLIVHEVKFYFTKIIVFIFCYQSKTDITNPSLWPQTTLQITCWVTALFYYHSC